MLRQRPDRAGRRETSMGQSHRFTALKQIPDVQKVVSFDMFKAMEVAKQVGKISTDALGYCTGGACAQFVMRWLSDLITGANEFGKGEAKQEQRDRGVLIAATGIPVYAVYALQSMLDDSWTALKDLAKNNGLKVLLDSDLIEGLQYERSLGKFLKEIADKSPPNLYYYLSIDATSATLGKSSSHALGAFIEDGSFDLHFFEPNTGEYVIKSDAVSPFAEKYVQIMKGLGWQFGKGKVCRVVKM
jgi:hypothetical protein